MIRKLAKSDPFFRLHKRAEKQRNREDRRKQTTYNAFVWNGQEQRRADNMWYARDALACAVRVLAEEGGKKGGQPMDNGEWNES